MEEQITGSIGCGYVVLLGVEDTDTEKDAEYLADGYYFFVTDAAGNYYYGHTLTEHNANCARARQVKG